LQQAGTVWRRPLPDPGDGQRFIVGLLWSSRCVGRAAHSVSRQPVDDLLFGQGQDVLLVASGIDAAQPMQMIGRCLQRGAQARLELLPGRGVLQLSDLVFARAQRVSAGIRDGAGAGSARVVRSAEIDDLKRIRGIGVLIEKRLNSVGVVSYGQIAEWTTEDIDRVSSSLDFKGRIERENWVEQARILASGGQTEFSRRVDRGEVETSRPKT